MGKDKKEFYSMVWKLVLPMAIQNVVNVAVISTDVIMLSKVGEKVLAGASLASQLQFIMTLICFGITSGATILTAQYWGKGDKRTVEKILGLSLKLSLIVSFFFFVLATFFPKFSMEIFSKDPAVIEEGVKYLRIVGFSYLLTAITIVYLNILRSIEKVFIATLVYTVSLCTNIGVNAILIFGLLGFPKMGIVGAAIGTLVARLIEIIMVAIYAKKNETLLRLHLQDIFKVSRILWKDYFHYATPVIFNELCWGAGIAANAAILGHLGSSMVAASSVTQILRQLSAVVTFGIANAAAILIGKTIGEKRYDLAQNYAKRLIRLSIISCSIGSLLIFCISPWVVKHFAVTPEIQDYLSYMLKIIVLYIIAQGISVVFIVGIFRAGGDSRYGLFVDFSTMWLGSILLGFIGAFILHLPVKIIYLLLMCDEFLKVPMVIKRYKKRKWLKNVTRDFIS
ncbi:MATE efflux family protein [Fusobacterium equinum]|uniref:MATE efflux family protein n=1 Tax=Fusobacterium equinum TaxID=134605 RepID=A0A133NHH6_9FUSO|nr:MATE family efflux transporter [Fusobacterium equinum]KXA15748.1 MATE efflux family protein [Fusobacterium equinum]